MKKRNAKPYLYILLGFLIVITIGTLLLLLPISTKGANLSLIEAFFTSSSAVCVTGLSIIDAGTRLSIFGQIILAILIQIGGLGVVTTVTLFLVFMGTKLGLNDRLLIRESLNQHTNNGLVRLIKSIIKITLIIELIGAIIFIIIFAQEYPLIDAIGLGIFHSISSFNNAGWDIFGNGNSMEVFEGNALLMISTSLMIILGGIGFIVIKDIKEKKNYKKLTVYSKVVIKMTVFLLVVGTLIIWVTEDIGFLNSFFLSVSSRTAGFSTISMASISSASILLIIILMFIGASPSSTGGGIKTTTLYNLYKSAVSFATGKPSLTHGKKIAEISIRKSHLLFMIALSAFCIASYAILLIEFNFGTMAINFQQIIFESMSAFGTVGLSMGITADLHTLSKIILCVLMVFGRVGPLTIVSITNTNWSRETTGSIEYIEEKILVG